jgi:hypothetical protein
MNRVKLFTNAKLAIAALLSPLLLTLASNGYADNIHATHNGAEPKNCLDSGCHAGIHTSETWDLDIPDAHVIMLGEVPGKAEDDGTPDKKQCAWCHTTVDLVQAAGTPTHTTANLRKRVDVRLCVLCHGRLPPESWIDDPDKESKHKQFYQTTFAELDPQPDGKV